MSKKFKTNICPEDCSCYAILLYCVRHLCVWKKQMACVWLYHVCVAKINGLIHHVSVLICYECADYI